MLYEYEVLKVYQGECQSIKKFDNAHEAYLLRDRLIRKAVENGYVLVENADYFDFMYFLVTRKEKQTQ